MFMKNNKQKFLEKFSKYCDNKLELVSDYVNRRTEVMVKCVDCGETFSFKPVNVYSDSKYGGCANCLFKNNYKQYTCLECGRQIYKHKNRLAKSGLVFCSRVCGNVYKNRQRINLTNSAEY